MSRSNRFAKLKSRLVSSKWLPLFLRSLIVSMVGMTVMILALTMLSGFINSMQYAEPRKLQVLLLDALADTADLLEGQDRDPAALQQTLVRDVERWLGELEDERQLEVVLGNWSSPGISIEVRDPAFSLLARTDLHGARLSRSDANVSSIRMPLVSRNGDLIGIAKADLVADYDLAASFRYAVKLTGLSLLVIVSPVALLIALLSAWNSIRFLNRQLNDVALVASAWSNGQFDARIELSGKRELKQLAQVLNQMAASLKDLYSLRSRLAAIEERGRVARELHDTIRQRLFGVSLQLGVAKAHWREQLADTAVLDQIQALVKDTQGELKRLIDSTYFGETEIGVAEEIMAMAREVVESAGIKPILNVHEPEPLESRHRHELARIAQEALSNIVRHAKAGQVMIELKEDAGDGVLRIEDDGIGFAVSDVAAGFGLNAMRARANELPEGRFDLESVPGRGTAVEIRWQVRNA